ncbi:amino acid ABC transporter ATP-binding protein [Treponema zioleckii]|uniref:amino acid ABC transporter ATP-binding protein n=1 Tax=Treponema zioleckii TaxID=331680 RepID=UPI00168A721E|nr:amino acid ABC transporter ATP-binding protein [Treponema zioleckii]
MIEIKGLKKKFQDNIVLDGINLSINKGDIIGIIGPSGTGKSTLLRSINLLEKPEEGSISIGQTSVSLPLKGSDKKKAIELRKKTGMVFQRFNLFEHKTALENVMEGLLVVQKKSKEEAKKIALEALDEVGLLNWQNHYPKHMSGGQQQRVAIARTLAMRPEVILLDEPTSALDPELIGEVLTVIQKIAGQGYTMVLVSHEMNFIKKISNRVLFLEGGHIIEDGSPKDVFEHPKSERAKEFFVKMEILKDPEYII